MQLTYQILKMVSIGAFLWYGTACLFSDAMVAEFERFGLSRLRRLTGALEVLGALGLLAGYWIEPLVPAASGGLVLLMGLGVITRVRVRDSVVETFPALVLLLVNLWIFWHSMRLAS